MKEEFKQFLNKYNYRCTTGNPAHESLVLATPRIEWEDYMEQICKK